MNWIIIIAALFSSTILATFPDDLAKVTEPGKIDMEKAMALIAKAQKRGKLNELSKAGHPAIVLLLQKGGHVNDLQLERDQLIFALMSQKGFDPNQVNKYGDTILIEVLRSYADRKNEYLEGLLKLKADPNKGGKLWTPLYEAVMRKDQKATELLLQYKADIDQGSKNGTTPILRAIKDGSYSIADLLLNYQENMKKANAKVESAESALKQHPEVEILKNYFPKAIAELIMSYLSKMMPQVSAGGSHTCAINGEGKLFCWGDDSDSQARIPSKLKNDFVKQVSAGGSHTCAINGESKLICWGNNDKGQSLVPPELIGEKIIQVRTSKSNTCAIDNNGRLFCFGDNSFGQTVIPEELKNSEFRQVSLGDGHICAIDRNNHPFCWGDKSLFKTVVPKELKGEVKQLSAGGQHTCGIDINDHLFCWGYSAWEQTKVPQALKNAQVREVMTGDRHTCAIDSNGHLYCWGNNGQGQIVIPKNLEGVEVKQVSLGNNHTCAIDSLDHLYCWGQNFDNRTTVPAKFNE